MLIKNQWILIVLIGLALSGCKARIMESYYLSAYDPETNTTNYFRTQFKGNSCFSKSKFSVGFYDKASVEQLFSESKLKREYLSSEIDIFSKTTGKRLKDISGLLSASKINVIHLKIDYLMQTNAATAALIGQYRTRAKQIQGKNSYLLTTVEQTDTVRIQAEKELARAMSASNNDTIRKYVAFASAGLRDAHASMQTIRLAFDSSVIVRFFDGAGNPIDVNNQTMVIFVATDISRFSEAIRQLAEAEETSQDILKIVLGKNLEKTEVVNKKSVQLDCYEQSLKQRLIEIQSSMDDGEVKKAILEAANSAAKSEISLFSNSSQIYEYLKGTED